MAIELKPLYKYELAARYGVHPNTINRYLKKLNEQRALKQLEKLDIPERGYLSIKILLAFIEHYGEP